MDPGKHISIPRVFSSGDFKEWLTRFNICAKSNGWDDSKKYDKIATFLEGEALVVYLEMDKSRTSFSDVVAELEKNFHPEAEEFNIITAFNERRMLSNETPRLFLHELKKLLKSSGIPEVAHEKLLLHQFISGLPSNISSHIKLLPGIRTPTDALEATLKLNAISATRETCNAAAIEFPSDLVEVKAAVQSLTAKVDELLNEREEQRRQVAGLRWNPQQLICFRCQKPGHPARLCRAPLPAPAPAPSRQPGNGRGRGVARTRRFGRNHQGSVNFS